MRDNTSAVLLTQTARPSLQPEHATTDTFPEQKDQVCSLWRRRTYRLSQNVRPLVWVECTVEKHSRSRTEYLVKARSQFKERSSASNVEIFLPLPPDAITPTVRASQVRTCHCSGVSGERETLERHWEKPVSLGGMPGPGARQNVLDFHGLVRRHVSPGNASICPTLSVFFWSTKGIGCPKWPSPWSMSLSLSQ